MTPISSLTLTEAREQQNLQFIRSRRRLQKYRLAIWHIIHVRSFVWGYEP